MTNALTRLYRGTHRTLRLVAGVAAVGAVFAWSTSARALSEPQGQPQMQLPRTEMRVGMHRIEAQVASSFDTRQIGLMFRKQMPAHEGMLFAFERAGVQCFWMRNTVLPLTAAFVADDGTIVNLADMQPMSDDSHCSTKPVRFVLEMNQGWFAQRGIKAGSQLRGGPFAP